MQTEPKKTTATMIVTVSGAWLESGHQVTPAMIERSVREALKDEFVALDAKVTVRRLAQEQGESDDNQV